MKSTRVPQTLRQSLSVVCALLMVGTGTLLMGQQQPPAPPPPAPGQAQGQFAQILPPEQLDDLVAPIALYPDNLLGQILVASTYPLEVVEAAQWLQQNRGLQGQQLVDAAKQQNWDPSVQALVVFPDVLTRLNSNVRWTTDLGNAFLAQQNDVMAAVQRMRARAQQNGKLNSNPQETVTTQTQPGAPPAIEIAPANPQVVYVPVYDPAYIWGPPVWGYYPPLYYPTFGFGFGFGQGIYIGSFFGGLGWGGWGWGPNWFGGGIFLNAGFFSHYGYGGYGAGFRGGLWAHNPVHRMGIAYPNRAVASRFGSTNFGNRATFNARPSQAGGSFSRPAAGAQSGGWSRFGQPGSGGAVAAPRQGFWSSRAQTQGGWSHFGSTGEQSLRATPSTGSSGGTYRASPYASGGGYSGAARSTPSYRSAAPSGGAARSSGGGGFHGGGGGGSHGGGGGHSGGRR